MSLGVGRCRNASEFLGRDELTSPSPVLRGRRPAARGPDAVLCVLLSDVRATFAAAPAAALLEGGRLLMAQWPCQVQKVPIWSPDRLILYEAPPSRGPMVELYCMSQPFGATSNWITIFRDSPVCPHSIGTKLETRFLFFLARKQNRIQFESGSQRLNPC